ncbi:MAG: hypothetical protein EWV55_01510 [Microcystis viridis Mv_BB_P_19951000_S69]|uniref:Resolvase/invertase-type recombinase catalytic domain-containing protein n=1 Tax=Microcystis viridis Mv_BB_P_19951000_S68D TaxID=2486270 RepID=A0A552H9Y7_MICVR|nr:MAG: hypothetical protein EWV77_21240 [Microcystis viridis Mv_BB_P_19951000_S68D]TRU70102.1 MAG: hypothetical protein EWV47_19590 [Microcystis viridis Mv_BB_P_19951000_S68]TRU79015.1 MAG: hypothetical protein EWV55_01510 [Microcystis viridis Mv_BB_P_19951000_S69]TRU80182.1 MAG: hypothetical protein EWV46_24105 [Microcystis viridis Mv_BB_P_19951000_S69D]
MYDVQSYVNGAARASLVCYCRVSSIKQRDDLERQVSFMRGFYPEAEIIKDIGSGLNFQRKGLRAIRDLRFDHVPFGRTQFAPTLWTKSVTVGATGTCALRAEGVC